MGNIFTVEVQAMFAALLEVSVRLSSKIKIIE